MKLSFLLLFVSFFVGEPTLVRLEGQEAEVSPAFVSITFDWWKHNDPTYGRKWGHAGILELNLTNPYLIELAKAYHGSFLRIGGSPEDSITYVKDMASCPPPKPRPSGSYYCSQVHPEVYGCLTRQRFYDIINFAQATGLNVIVGLNACYGRKSANSTMDFSNIKFLLQELLECQQAGGCNALFGFEFGNELNGHIDGAQWGKDFATLAGIISQMWGPGAETAAPRILGPDTGFAKSWITDALKAGAAKPMYAMTYHQYVNCRPGMDAVFSMDCLVAIKNRGETAVNLVRSFNGYDAHAWIGESAEHSGGGILGQTNTFMSSFYYVTQFGMASRAGINVVARQCFAGGYYELVNHTSWEPNPDYYTGLLWRRLVDTSILRVDLGDNYMGTLAAFAARKSTGYTVVLVNYSKKDTRDVSILWPTTQNGEATMGCMYELSGHLRSSVVNLNGEPIVYTHGKGAPLLVGKKTTIDQITLAPATIVYLTTAVGTWGNVQCAM